MYLCTLLCGSLGVVKFDIEFMDPCFLGNIPVLPILKCLMQYLGLLLIDVLTYVVLFFFFFKLRQLLCLLILDVFPLVVLVCFLEVKQRFKHGRVTNVIFV